MTSQRVRRVGSAVAAVLGLLVLAAGCTSDGPVQTPTPQTTVVSESSSSRLVEVIARVEPSVVTIRTEQGAGSGVVYRQDGVLVTNAHVVGSTRQVRVVFADGTELEGRVTATDDITDLAVVRVDRTDLPAIPIRLDLPRQGEIAVAIGSPLGFENTVTQGIISGVGRDIPAAVTQGRPLVDLIQTDAAISPGNSGGALIDAEGRLVGINEAYIPPSTGAVSLGFAIPSSTVVDVVDQLLANGRVAHPYLGVGLTTLTADIAETLGVDVNAGALVRQVQAGSPAAAAGIRPADVIVEMNGAEIANVSDIYGELRECEPGTTVPVTVYRDASRTEVQVTLGTLSR
jgi:S1-C subfamily serine protease